MGAKWTGELSEKGLHMTTNLEGGEERREEVSSHGCSTRLFTFCLKFLLRSLDSRAANGARVPPETPRSRFGDRRCQGLSRVGEMEQDEDEDR